MNLLGAILSFLSQHSDLIDMIRFKWTGTRNTYRTYYKKKCIMIDQILRLAQTIEQQSVITVVNSILYDRRSAHCDPLARAGMVQESAVVLTYLIPMYLSEVDAQATSTATRRKLSERHSLVERMTKLFVEDCVQQCARRVVTQKRIGEKIAGLIRSLRWRLNLLRDGVGEQAGLLRLPDTVIDLYRMFVRQYCAREIDLASFRLYPAGYKRLFNCSYSVRYILLVKALSDYMKFQDDGPGYQLHLPKKLLSVMKSYKFLSPSALSDIDRSCVSEGPQDGNDETYRCAPRLVMQTFFSPAGVDDTNDGEEIFPSFAAQLNQNLNQSFWDSLPSRNLNGQMGRLLKQTRHFCRWISRDRKENVSGKDMKCLVSSRLKDGCCRNDLLHLVSIGGEYEVVRTFHISPQIVYTECRTSDERREEAKAVANACSLLILLASVRNVVFSDINTTNCRTTIITSNGSLHHTTLPYDMMIALRSQMSPVNSKECLKRVLDGIQKKETVIL